MKMADFLVVAGNLRKEIQAGQRRIDAARKEIEAIPVIADGSRQQQEVRSMASELRGQIANEAKGKTGKEGKAGPKGADGKAGRDGRDGLDGKDGIDGFGDDGKDGINVTDADIDFDNRFTFHMSDGSEVVTTNNLNLEDSIRQYGRGPAGAPGAQGAQGPIGAGGEGTVGADGAPGSRWFSGSGAPSSSIGATGDYYLDGDTGNIWVRTGSQWFPSGENIQGDKGEQGVKGETGTSVVLKGAVDSFEELPLDAEEGDLWLITSEGGLGYVSDGLGGWTDVGFIRGPAGEKGDKGDNGDTGDSFVYADFTQEQLADLTGPAGEKGDTGEKGDAGDGADIDLDELNTLYAPKSHTHNYAPNQVSSISIKGQNYVGMLASGNTVNPPELKAGQAYFCKTTLKLMVGY